MFFRPAKQRLARAQAEFHRDQRALEEKFIEAAARSGRPRGLRWVQCVFPGEAVFAQDPATGQLQALTPMEVSFEAIAGGDMEDVEAVSNIRAATAVFRHDGERWTTDGRTVFNLNPQQTIAHFRLQSVEAS
jgi:hypothetical protein